MAVEWRYSELYKRNIRGDDCCPFWRVDKGGTCVGSPFHKKCVCKANSDGSGCPVFPKTKEQI